MSQTKVKSGLISDQSITASKLDVTGNGNSGEVLASAGDGSFVWTGGIATELYTDNAIAALVDSAPGTLDTLNELAAALGDDANFAGTVTTALATKIDGSGTANYVPKWTDGDTLTDSIIYQDGNNVGINKTSPLGKLHIKKGAGSGASSVSANADELVLESDGLAGLTILTPNTGQGRIHFGDPESQTIGKILYSHANDSMVFQASSTDIMTLVNSSVGIGTSNPQARLNLEHTSAFSMLRFTNTNGGTDSAMGTTSAGDFAMQIGGAERMRIDSSGNVSLNGTDNRPLAITSFNTASAGAGWDLEATSISGEISLSTAGTERMRIDSNGNVGIGTTNPQGILHISHSDSNNGLLLQNTNNVNNLQILQNIRENEGLIFQRWANGTFVSNLLNIGYDGNVGIGLVNHTERLQIYEGGLNSYKTYTSTNAGAILTSYQSEGSPFTKTTDLVAASDGTVPSEIRLFTRTNGSSSISERMRIHSNGNVSIGSTANSVKLLVFGNGNAQDTVTRLQNGLYGSADSSGECKLELGFSNHIAAGISAYKQTTNTTGLKFYVEYGYNAPVEGMRLDVNKNLHVDGDVIAYSTTVSDERLKDNITTIDNALDKVCELRGVEYDWNASSRSGQHDMGVIAQEVEKVFPFIVREKEMPLVDGNTYKTVDYEKLVGVLIEAVKELKQEVESLKSK